MSAIKFFVEGKADELFLTAFCKSQFDFELSHNSFVAINGSTFEEIKTNSDLFIRNSAKENNTGINLLIFDADRSNFVETKKNLEQWKGELSIAFELFLFPNNQDDGNLETLLENIANPEKAEVFGCFDKYVNCVESLNKGYSLPDLHSKFFAYEEAVLSRSQFKKISNKPDKYLLEELYNLNSDCLKHLKDFLSDYFTT